MPLPSSRTLFVKHGGPRLVRRGGLVLALMAFVATSVAMLYQSGFRLVQIDPASVAAGAPPIVSRAELARIESQYQERLDALRHQLQVEREQLQELHRIQAAEVARFHRIDKERSLLALHEDKVRTLREHETEKARQLQHLQSQLSAARTEFDRELKQRATQIATLTREQTRIEQQYRKQLADLQKRLAGTVERIAQIETAQVGLMRSLGLPNPDPKARPARGGAFQPLDRPRPGADTFEAEVQSTTKDLDLLERGVQPIEQLWRSRLLPFTQRPVALPLEESFYISSHFGLRTDPMTRRASRHEGVDLVTRMGAPVIATASGRVTRSGPAGPHGQLIEIEHAGGYVTRYAHLSARNVQQGEQVVLGQTIGRVGRSGRATGVHLHYELLQNGVAIDPTRAFSQEIWARHDRESFSYR